MSDEVTLTGRQHEALCFIGAYRRRRRLYPTIAEVAKALSVSKVTAHQHMNDLWAKGMILKAERTARGISITRLGWSRIPPAVKDAEHWHSVATELHRLLSELVEDLAPLEEMHG